MKGRKPDPTVIRLVKGNRQKKPLPKNEPKPVMPEQLMEPKCFLGEDAEAVMTPTTERVWEHIAPELHSAGILTRLDYPAAIAMCRYLADWIDDLRIIQKTGRWGRGEDGKLYLIPMVRAARQSFELAASLMSSFGMTPSDRTRVHVALQKATNDEDFYRGAAKKQ